MAYRIIIKPLVFFDAEDAFHWYNKQMKGLGNRFYHQFLDTIETIKSKPFAFSYLEYPIRRCKMTNFPYKIYYITDDKTIIILGLAHTKRGDSYIKRSLK